MPRPGESMDDFCKRLHKEMDAKIAWEKKKEDEEKAKIEKEKAKKSADCVGSSGEAMDNKKSRNSKKVKKGLTLKKQLISKFKKKKKKSEKKMRNSQHSVSSQMNHHSAKLKEIKTKQDEDLDSSPSENEASHNCELCGENVLHGHVCCTITCKRFRTFFCDECFDDHICNKGKKEKKVHPAALSPLSSNSSNNGEDVDSSDEETQSAQTNSKCKKVQERLHKKRIKVKKDDKTKTLLKVHLGSTDCVTHNYENGKRVFKYKCPECGRHIEQKLARHMATKHEYDQNRSKLLQSKMRVLYLWCIRKKHNAHLPLPCEKCYEWYPRLDQHLKTSKEHKSMDEEERVPILVKMKEKYWSSQRTPQGEHFLNEHAENDFARRAPAQKKITTSSEKSRMSSKDKGLQYTPGTSVLLSETQKTEWNIKENDYFSIYFKTTKELLDFFQEILISSSAEKATAIQHRNQVELIWSCIDENMNMFPNNLLSNVHLFRDYYHLPAFKAIGKPNGVQAGTLRARYVSFGFLLQFLRKYQIFAGLHRSDIQMIEQTVSDFNKDLNPHIKQRKVEVRRNKTKNLLTARHFIKFGESRFVQSLLSAFENRHYRTFSHAFAIDFRNYLIATLCICNGLRSSNIIELRLKDFHEYSTADEYPGHKIVVNDNYKTSTIYGEKFIVVPDNLFEHFIFYEKMLRPLIFAGKSARAFVTGGSLPAMTQTSVASALTSVFTKAKVLLKSEYQRVSCTRIRCGLATFACNEGGFETAFIANHFMKNKEETTALHYNMLANRRHALNIAMKLYDAFKVSNGETLEANREEIQKFLLSAPMKDKSTIMTWLKRNDQSLTDSEMKSIEGILEEVDQTTGVRNFYSSGGSSQGSMSNDIPAPDSKEVDESKASEREDEDEELEENEEEDWNDNERTAKPRKMMAVCNSPTYKEVAQFLTPPKRFSKVFGEEDVLILREKCYKFINGKPIQEQPVRDSLGGELKEYKFEQIRTRIMHERTGVLKKKKKMLLSKHDSAVPKNGDLEMNNEITQQDNDDTITSFEKKTYPRRKRSHVNYEENDTPITDTSQSNSSTEKSKDEEDITSKTLQSSPQASSLSPSATKKNSTSLQGGCLKPSPVIDYCNKEFKKKRPERRKNVALHRKLETEKAKLQSVKGKDQEGFEKLYIDKFINGYGIFTTREFTEDDFLLTYKGELVTLEEGEKREKEYEADENAGNFLYFFSNAFGKLRGDWCVDATHVEGYCKYVNDSENGNCKMSLVRTEDDLYLCLFASKYIPSGTELRYNYGEKSKNLWWRNLDGCSEPLTKGQLNLTTKTKVSDLDIIPATPKKKVKRTRVSTDFNIEYRARRHFKNDVESIEIMADDK